MSLPRLIILCFDALDQKFIREEYNYLQLVTNGKTDISEFKLPRSVILWSSFLTSKNMEAYLKDMLYEFQLGLVRVKIPTRIGDKLEKHIWVGWSGKLLGKFAPLRKYLKERIWRIRLNPDNTFLKFFSSYKAIDMVALTHKTRRHKKERELMGSYFNYDVEDEGILDKIHEFFYFFYSRVTDVNKKSKNKRLKRSEIEKIYKKYVWDGYKESKKEFLTALDKDYEVILFFTPLADLIGHFYFGVEKEMEKVYHELNTLVGCIVDMVKANNTTIIGISDHGMEQVVVKAKNGSILHTRYGDHSEVKQGTYFMNRSIEEIKKRYEHIIKNLQKNTPVFDEYEHNQIITAINRLENNNPTLRDFYHIVRIFA